VSFVPEGLYESSQATVPYGTDLLVRSIPGNKLPGCHHSVPPGQDPPPNRIKTALFAHATSVPVPAFCKLSVTRHGLELFAGDILLELNKAR